MARRKAGWVYLNGICEDSVLSPYWEPALCDADILSFSTIVAAFFSHHIIVVLQVACSLVYTCLSSSPSFIPAPMTSQSCRGFTNTHPIFPNGFGDGSTGIPNNVVVEAPSAQG